MLGRRAVVGIQQLCSHSTTAHGLKHVHVLETPDLEEFRQHAFNPSIPALFPQGTFSHLPAIHKWFTGNLQNPDKSSLNRSYLSRFGSTLVPLEITHDNHFNRVEQPLSFFLECVHASTSTYNTRPRRYFSSYVPGARAVRRTKDSNDFFSASSITTPTAKIYLAQASIADLPQAMRDDLPTPDLVLRAGRGDVYDSSIWIGEAPTYTPLHRDPNPNLFVQLAGKKVVRLFRPEVGRAMFARVQEKIEGKGLANMRGEEMMQGAEKRALEKVVWVDCRDGGYEAELASGDGLFIPKGWWHSVKGVGDRTMTGSVNWWFR